MREDSRNYVLVGTFVLAMLVALITWIMLLSGPSGPTDDYHIVYDNVLGLKTGVEILYEGYPVGHIEDISPVDHDGRQRYRVDVTVRRGWPIPEDSRATIAAPNLLSGVLIDIEAGRSGTLLEPDSEIPGEEAADVFAVAKEVAVTVSEVGEELRSLLESLAADTPEILDNVETFTSEINRTVEQINTLLDPSNVGRVRRILVNLETTTNSFASVADDLNRTRGQVDDLIQRVDEMLDAKHGDVGQAMAELNHSLESVARHIDAITHNLEATTRNMNEFSRQIRENPSVIIRGRETDDDSGASN